MIYKNNIRFYKDYDLCRVGEIYAANLEDIPEDLLTESLSELFEDSGDSERCILRYFDVEDNGIYEYAEYLYFDGAERAYALEDLLRPAPHYLVVAHNSTWTGATGYKFFDSLENVLDRDCETEIVPEAVSKGGKCLVCRESSHDVPQGARTSITALTDAEYVKLSHWLTPFEDVISFAEKCEAKTVN